MNIVLQAWPWYVSGPLIAFIMFLLLFTGKNFGMSANLRTMCTIGGASKWSDFFRFDWKSQKWNLMVVFGSIIGGYIAANFLSIDESIKLSDSTNLALTELGFSPASDTYLPKEIFSADAFTSGGWIILALGGLLVGFGARYAGGCTSGHAISGLSDLQLPSLIAVIGFFVGGLIMTHFLLPLIF